jgi:hypothetical protein
MLEQAYMTAGREMAKLQLYGPLQFPEIMSEGCWDNQLLGQQVY